MRTPDSLSAVEAYTATPAARIARVIQPGEFIQAHVPLAIELVVEHGFVRVPGSPLTTMEDDHGLWTLALLWCPPAPGERPPEVAWLHDHPLEEWPSIESRVREVQRKARWSDSTLLRHVLREVGVREARASKPDHAMVQALMKWIETPVPKELQP